VAGHPFVGPSGQLLDRALDAAGIDRSDTYVTNAVKHFKWTRAAGTKRRIHKKPSAREVRACRPWLEAEIAAVEPPAILALGATAAQSLFGAATKVTAQRGKLISTPLAAAGFVTVHPSAVLRAPGAERAIAERAFISDLKKVARHLSR
jgi:uracil-DNA glycosylase family protein